MATKTAAEVFRDYATDGVPSSGAHKPIKADIRELLAVLEAGGVIPSLQIVTGSSDTIADDTSHVLVNRSAPSTTGLTLPDASTRNGRPLAIIDYSSSVVDHSITLTPVSGAQKIMRQSTWGLASNAYQLASVTLIPIEDPDDSGNTIWIIAP